MPEGPFQTPQTVATTAGQPVPGAERARGAMVRAGRFRKVGCDVHGCADRTFRDHDHAEPVLAEITLPGRRQVIRRESIGRGGNEDGVPHFDREDDRLERPLTSSGVWVRTESANVSA